MIWWVSTMQTLALLMFAYSHHLMHRRVTELERARMPRSGSSSGPTTPAKVPEP